jgi:hypothetical protein
LNIAIVEGDQPKVVRVSANKTAVGKLPRRKEGGAIPVNPEFILDVKEFPRTGEFRIDVTAGASVPDGRDYPRMRVSLGCVPGIVHVPRKLIGEVDVTATVDQPQTFVFRGRMEDYPQSGDREFGNVAFKGVIVLIDFLDADGNELRYPNRHYSDPKPKPKPNAKPQSKPQSKTTDASTSTKKTAPVSQNETQSPKPQLDIQIRSVTYQAPFVTSWPPKSHLDLLGPVDEKSEVTEEVRANNLLKSFMTKAFRRPVTKLELARTLQLFKLIRPSASSFEDAMRECFASTLVSPHFLYLVDGEDDFAIASRVSYFLWSTMPDAHLLKLARTGKLRETSVLSGEVERLLNDPRSAEFVNRFADQWFDLGGLDRVAVNPEFYPNFDNNLKRLMQEETRGVLAEIVENDLSCLELIQSDWTVVNRKLAKHYSLANPPRSAEFTRVPLSDNDRRGGILNHGSFLLSNSNGESSHPIKRAVWILDRLLASPPAPPPPDVPELEADSPDLKGLTLKQQLEAHRKKDACNSCHQNIDPWGIALENFDAIGLYRTNAAARITGKGPTGLGPKLDSTTTLPNGDNLLGANELKQYLIENRREQFAQAVVKRLTTYAIGRSLDIGDKNSIEQLTDQFIKDDFRLRKLIKKLVENEIFLQP